MKLVFWSTLAVTASIMMGCSGMKTPKAELASHDADRNIPAIDQLIVEMKQDYINKCYMPVAKRRPPENACQTDLFQLLERRYQRDYMQKHVDMAANDLFFKDVNTEIITLARSNPEVREAIKSGAFRSTDEMTEYYKEMYKFDTH